MKSELEYEQDEGEVTAHTTRIAHLSEDQRDKWVNELSAKGINFS